MTKTHFQVAGPLGRQARAWGREGQARVFRAQGLRAAARALTFPFATALHLNLRLDGPVTTPAAPPWRKSSASSGYCCGTSGNRRRGPGSL